MEGGITVIFIGQYTPKFPASYLGRVDAAGISYFEIENSNALRSHRIVRLMRAVGFDMWEPPGELEEYACQRAESMTVWPAEGSMVCENGLIIIKIGESHTAGH